jgi:hypothetical protein
MARYAGSTGPYTALGRPGCNEVHEVEKGLPLQAATIQLRPDIVPRLTNFFQMPPSRKGLPMLGSGQMVAA